MSNLEKQYEQNVKAWKDMGMGFHVTLEDIKTKLTKNQKEAISKGKASLVISPSIDAGFTFYDLIKAFDKNQPYGTYIYKELWEQYDFSQPTSIIVANNELMGINKTLEKQRKIKGTFINPVEYIMLQAINRPDYLDQTTWCRFPQYENKSVDDFSCVPGAYSSGFGRVDLYVSRGDADSGAGVRLSVGQRIILQDLALPSATPFSSEQAIEYLKSEGYKIYKEF